MKKPPKYTRAGRREGGARWKHTNISSSALGRGENRDLMLNRKSLSGEAGFGNNEVDSNNVD